MQLQCDGKKYIFCIGIVSLTYTSTEYSFLDLLSKLFEDGTKTLLSLEYLRLSIVCSITATIGNICPLQVSDLIIS